MRIHLSLPGFGLPRRQWFALIAATTLVAGTAPSVSQDQPRQVFSAGVARVDITPDYPIRLTGYAARKSPSEGVEQRLWAKALALRHQRSAPVLLLTVDTCGVPGGLVEEVARRLSDQAGLERDRLAVCASHTHSAPMLAGFAPNIFAEPVPADQADAIDRYTRWVTDQLERVGLAALRQLEPATVAWGLGQATFAANRRTAGGPVDHAVPVLCVRNAAGAVRAVLANYACHCTTLGAGMNRMCGDWAGYAQEQLEQTLPGATALISIGCGADANPNPRGGPDHGLALARQHGQALAAEVTRVSSGSLSELVAAPQARLRRVRLPFQAHFSRAQWQERATRPGIVGYHARRNLERLERGERLPETLPYVLQSWSFGDRLAMVFLAGEVVVDYALWMKAEFAADRLWITAYANDVPCYIPSRRILDEGGYEAEDSLWYYDRPQRLAPETETVLQDAVRRLLPRPYRAQL